ncbi:MAG: ATP-binding protein [Desulfobacterales bacterium]|nr:ATP-binding protein [Desulfobacterales bacterium]
MEVGDTGIGMPEHVKSKLFEPFFTTKKVGKGTGLGTSISYGIVREYDGTHRRPERAPGSGTTFRLTLPGRRRRDRVQHDATARSSTTNPTSCGCWRARSRRTGTRCRPPSHGAGGPGRLRRRAGRRSWSRTSRCPAWTASRCSSASRRARPDAEVDHHHRPRGHRQRRRGAALRGLGLHQQARPGRGAGDRPPAGRGEDRHPAAADGIHPRPGEPRSQRPPAELRRRSNFLRQADPQLQRRDRRHRRALPDRGLQPRGGADLRATRRRRSSTGAGCRSSCPEELAGFFEQRHAGGRRLGKELPVDAKPSSSSAKTASRIPVLLLGQHPQRGRPEAGRGGLLPGPARDQAPAARAGPLRTPGRHRPDRGRAGPRDQEHPARAQGRQLPASTWASPRRTTQKLRKGWDMIKRGIERTSNLVMDLLSYSKEREPEFDACAPNAIAAEVCDLVRERAEQERTRDRSAISTPPIGTGAAWTPTRCTPCLLNLVSNAAGRLSVRRDTAPSAGR